MGWCRASSSGARNSPPSDLLVANQGHASRMAQPRKALIRKASERRRRESLERAKGIEPPVTRMKTSFLPRRARFRVTVCGV